MNSASYLVSKHDAPGAFWGRVIRAGERIPLPRDVKDVLDMPGHYFRVDERIDLHVGDFAIAGIERRDRRNGSKWAWSHKLVEPGPNYSERGPDLIAYEGIEYCYPVPLEHVRPYLAEGRGRLAELVRTIWAVRLGLAQMRYPWRDLRVDES